jgi:hypothetical protein
MSIGHLSSDEESPESSDQDSAGPGVDDHHDNLTEYGNVTQEGLKLITEGFLHVLESNRNLFDLIALCDGPGRSG